MIISDTAQIIIENLCRALCMYDIIKQLLNCAELYREREKSLLL